MGTYALEESEDAEGAQHLEVGEGAVRRQYVHHEHDADGDNEEVEDVPARRPELSVRPSASPNVEDELEEEERVEHDVERIPFDARARTKDRRARGEGSGWEE